MSAQDSANLIPFNFKETMPDKYSFMGRFTHFMYVTNPVKFFAMNKDIEAGVALVKRYKELAGKTEDGTIMITEKEKKDIIKGIEYIDTSCNDIGEIVFRPCRLCGFTPMNVPILIGMICTAPTMRNTIMWNWINQTYNAGMNFGNKNNTSPYTNTDLMKGYVAAVTSALSVASGMRYLSSGLAKGAKGSRLLMINGMIGCIASACAGYCNAFFMRQCEMQKGIKCYKDEHLTHELGFSLKCAESAVYQTCFTRSCLSFMCIGTPTLILLAVKKMGASPKSALGKNALEVLAVAIGLQYGLPVSVSIFPHISDLPGKDIEPEYHQYEKVYFSKGL